MSYGESRDHQDTIGGDHDARGGPGAGSRNAGGNGGGFVNSPGTQAKKKNKSYEDKVAEQVATAKKLAPGSTTPIGDTSPSYKGFPRDRILQAGKLAFDVITGGIFGMARDMISAVRDDRHMTQPDGRTLNHNRDNTGATRGTKYDEISNTAVQPIIVNLTGDGGELDYSHHYYSGYLMNMRF